MSNSIDGLFRSKQPMTNPLLLPPLTLAYLGDVIYELFVRNRLLADGHIRVSDLHKNVIRYVRARGQADAIAYLLPNLSAQEQDVVRRGRNAKGHAAPKGSDATEYAAATSFETLIGFLFLAGREQRLAEVLDLSASYLEAK